MSTALSRTRYPYFSMTLQRHWHNLCALMCVLNLCTRTREIRGIAGTKKRFIAEVWAYTLALHAVISV